MHQKVAILDFGGQYSHLIANRVRRLGVYSEIVMPSAKAPQLKHYKGLILSGGPNSVYDKGAPHCDPEIFNLGIPVLGICYGHQLMQHLLGGKVVSGKTKEYGLANLIVNKPVGIFAGLVSPTQVWMSHGDTVQSLAPGFEEAGRSADLPLAAVTDPKRHFYGTQFHVEVTHTPEGMKLLDHFLNECQVQRDWSIEAFIQEEMTAVRQKIGNKKVFLLVSGGVDSTVAFALLEKSLGKDRVVGLLVDHGLMRLNEARKVKAALSDAGFKNLHVVDKSSVFFEALKGQTDPEMKRRTIGDLFWKVKEDAVEELNLNPEEWIMGQGTIYPDTIETGGTKHADTIKTHHNRVDLIQKMIAEGRVIEPLAQLYKDEVRQLGEKCGLPHDLVWRQPFPGPGLGVRILCSPEQPEADLLDSDPIQDYVQKTFHLNDAFVHVLPIKSVGVQGDGRSYKHPAVLFTASHDWELLERVSTGITNRFFGINRVVLTLSGPSQSFKVHPATVTPDRVHLLQKIDDLVSQTMQKTPADYGIWQFPVILAPVSTENNKESIILRPVCSTEAMTASFAKIDWQVLDSLAASIAHFSEITHLFYDLTHKPPGTIEWE